MYVYILKCSDNSYYTGVTNNIERRIAEHSQGIDPQCYTFKKRPLQLVYSNYLQTPMQAIEFEKQIKRWSRKKKEALIKGDFRELIDLAKK